MDNIDLPSDGTYYIRQPVRKTFDPKKDITAYELASILAHVQGQALYQEEWDKLDQSITRHFK